MTFIVPIRRDNLIFSDCFFIAKKGGCVIMDTRKNMEYFFKKQSRKTKERIRDMENSTWNNYKLSCDDDNSIPGIKSEGVLHGWKF